MTATIIHDLFAARARKETPRLNKEKLPDPWAVTLLAGRMLHSLFFNHREVGGFLLKECRETELRILSYRTKGYMQNLLAGNTHYDSAMVEEDRKKIRQILQDADFFLNEPDYKDRPYAKTARFTVKIAADFLDIYKSAQEKNNKGDINNLFHANPTMALLVISEVLFDIEQVMKRDSGKALTDVDGLFPLNDAHSFRTFLRNELSLTRGKQTSEEKQHGIAMERLKILSSTIDKFFKQNEYALSTANFIPHPEIAALWGIQNYLKPYKPSPLQSNCSADVTILSHFRGRGKPPQELQLPQAPYSPPPIFEI